MKIEEITQEFLRHSFSYDPLTGIIVRIGRGRACGQMYGAKMKSGYILGMIGGRKGINIYAYRLAWFYMTGKWPKHQIDHKNRIRNDNRWENLREATATQNRWNSEDRRKSCGHRGIYWHPNKRKWQVRLAKDGKLKSFGYYRDLQDAVAACKIIREALCGEFIARAA